MRRRRKGREYGNAIVSGGSPAELVEEDEGTIRGEGEETRSLDELDEEGRLAQGHGVRCAHAGRADEEGRG